MTARETLHQLVDELSEGELDVAREFLQSLRARSVSVQGGRPAQSSGLPPILAHASIDAEPLTDEEEAALAEAYDDLREGNTVSMAEIQREFGG